MNPAVGIPVFILLLSFSFTMSGEEIAVTPSRLKSELLTLPKDCKTLIISGAVNEEDQQWFRLLPESVSTLDLSRLSLSGDRCIPYIFFNSTVRNLTLPRDLEEIGEWSFAESALDTLVLPISIKRLGEGAFYNCKNLKSVRILAEYLPKIERYTFSGCDSLRAIVLPAVDSVGERAFKNSGISSLKLPYARYLGDFALAEMPLLEEVVLPADVEVGEGVFYGDSLLSAIPLNFSDTPALVVAGTGLTNMERSVGGETIGAGAFDGVDIDHLLLNANVKRIESNAFHNMARLQSVDVSALSSNIPLTASDAFSGVETGNVRLITESGTEYLWAQHPVWGKFHSVSSGYDAPREADDVNLSMEFDKSGSLLSLICNRIIDKVGVYDIDGKVVAVATPYANVYNVEIKSNGSVLLVDARVGTKQFIKKIFNGKE